MNRKDDHVLLANFFKENNKCKNDFDDIKIIHNSFSEIALKDTRISTNISGFSLKSPFFINAMTGGSHNTKNINQKLAIIARESNLMMATGSVSVALKDPKLIESFKIVRKEFPKGIILSNIGAGASLETAKRAIDLFHANGLQIHLNMPQELVMPEGSKNFHNWLKKIEKLVREVEVPIIVKEVGFGMTRETVKNLLDIGVKTIDVSGVGGASFTQIENTRRKKKELDYLNHFGQSTVNSLLEAQEIGKDFDIIASGGIRNAYDIFKALCLGAKAVALSSTILNSLMNQGIENTIDLISEWKSQLKLLYTLVGIKKTNHLQTVPLLLSGTVKDWCYARRIDIQNYSMRKKFS